MRLTADDLWPLVAMLSPEERIRLIRLTLGRAVAVPSDAEGYDQMPVGSDEFSADSREDDLAWDSSGWDDVK